MRTTFPASSPEEVDVEYGLRRREIILLQVVVQPGTRRPKVGDASRDRDAGADLSTWTRPSDFEAAGPGIY